MKADTDAVGPDHNLILADTIAEADITPIETIPGHATGPVDVITEVLPSTHTPMPIHIALARTPHIEDHPHTVALQLTLETTEDHACNQHMNQLRKSHIRIYPIPEDPMEIYTIREIQESP